MLYLCKEWRQTLNYYYYRLECCAKLEVQRRRWQGDDDDNNTRKKKYDRTASVAAVASSIYLLEMRKKKRRKEEEEGKKITFRFHNLLSLKINQCVLWLWRCHLLLLTRRPLLLEFFCFVRTYSSWSSSTAIVLNQSLLFHTLFFFLLCTSKSTYISHVQIGLRHIH